jgi:ribosomal protein S18 acetylase RimI-like enzyme
MSGAEHVEISRAGLDEAAGAAALLRAFNAEYDEPAPPAPALAARLSLLLAGEQIVVLLAREEAPVGVAVLRLRPGLWSEREDAYLEELYVVPERRGHGIGRRLLEAAMDAARSAGADHFDLTTAETDIEARSLYESVGMTNREGGPEGPRMLYYELDLQFSP